MTPSSATTDTLSEIIMEQLRLKQRRVEQKRYKLWLILKETGHLLDSDEKWEMNQAEIDQLSEERKIKNESELA